MLRLISGVGRVPYQNYIEYPIQFQGRYPTYQTKKKKGKRKIKLYNLIY